jgi:hypothetical protein
MVLQYSRDAVMRSAFSFNSAWNEANVRMVEKRILSVGKRPFQRSPLGANKGVSG